MSLPDRQIALRVDGTFYHPSLVLIHRPFEKKKDKIYHASPSAISPMNCSWKYSISFDWAVNTNGITDVDGTSYFVFAENGDIFCSNQRPA